MKRFEKSKMAFPFFLLLSIVLYSFVYQNNSSNYIHETNDSLKTNQPKVDVKINKKYDENGNLIQYDSSYSIIYSSPNTDFQFYSMDADSIFAELSKKMKTHSFFDNNDFFNNSDDKNFQENFMNINPFENIKRMNEMIKKMFPEIKQDSLIIKPQQNNEPIKENKPANMITL